MHGKVKMAWWKWLGGCLLLWSCSSAQGPEQPGQVTPEPSKPVDEEVHVIRELEGSCVVLDEDVQYEVIRDARSWAARFHHPEQQLEAPAVDFSKEMVLIGYRGNAYTHAVIVGSAMRAGCLHVAVRVEGSAQPIDWYNACVVPRFEGEVVFEVDEP